jgi:hypothetical protein
MLIKVGGKISAQIYFPIICLRKWLNVELNNVESETFRGALKANKIKYEASNCGYGLTHFEVFVNTSEIDILEGVLSTL